MDHPPNQKESVRLSPVSFPELYFHNAMRDNRGRELDSFLFLPEQCFHSVDFFYLHGK